MAFMMTYRVDPNKMLHFVASHLGLHGLLLDSRTAGLNVLTLSIQDTSKKVLWQTVKTQMKCSAFHKGLLYLLR